MFFNIQIMNLSKILSLNFVKLVKNVVFVFRFLDDVIESTLSLLCIHQTSTVGNISQISPIHFISLIDTKASWFGKWMVSFTASHEVVYAMSCGMVTKLQCDEVSLLIFYYCQICKIETKNNRDVS